MATDFWEFVASFDKKTKKLLSTEYLLYLCSINCDSCLLMAVLVMDKYNNTNNRIV